MTDELTEARERLTEAARDAALDHEDDVAQAWEDGERPDLWPAPEVTVSLPDLRTLLAALDRRDAEVERLTEGHREAVRLIGKLSAEAGEAKGRLEMSEAAGVVDMWREHAVAAEARAQAAEQRLKAVTEALAAITDMAPATQEVTLASMMADVGRAALAAAAQAPAGENSDEQ